MLHVGGARHREPVPGREVSGRLSIEFVNVGGWLTNGDMALDSCAQFLAVAEHRLIHARARSIGHQLRKADRQSVWARVRINFLVVMLVLVSSAQVVLP